MKKKEKRYKIIFFERYNVKVDELHELQDKLAKLQGEEDRKNKNKEIQEIVGKLKLEI